MDLRCLRCDEEDNHTEQVELLLLKVVNGEKPVEEIHGKGEDLWIQLERVAELHHPLHQDPAVADEHALGLDLRNVVRVDRLVRGVTQSITAQLLRLEHLTHHIDCERVVVARTLRGVEGSGGGAWKKGDERRNAP